MKRWLSALMALILSLSLSVTCFAQTVDENTSEGDTAQTFAPGSKGMYHRSPNGEVEFISGSDILSYGFQGNSSSSYFPYDDEQVPLPQPRVDEWSRVIPSGKYRSIALIESIYADKSSTYGTGWMMGPTGMATCAHAIYDRDTDEWPVEINVYFGWTEGVYKKVLKPAHSYIGGEYAFDDLDDWGILTFDSDPGYGYWGFTSTSNASSLVGTSVNAVGYHTLNAGELDKQYMFMIQSSGTILDTHSRALDGITISTAVFPGGSGGPLFKASNNSVVAIPVFKYDNGGAKVALAINPWLYNAYMEHSGR